MTKIVIVASIISAIIVSVGRWVINERKAQRQRAGLCDHQWEPYSEPKDVEVKKTETNWAGYQAITTAKDYVGKYQERTCSKCNLYERRWI